MNEKRSHGVFAQVILVSPSLFDTVLRHCQKQCRICARGNGHKLIALLRSERANRVDMNQLGTRRTSFLKEMPTVEQSKMSICTHKENNLGIPLAPRIVPRAKQAVTNHLLQDRQTSSVVTDCRTATTHKFLQISIDVLVYRKNTCRGAKNNAGVSRLSLILLPF